MVSNRWLWLAIASAAVGLCILYLRMTSVRAERIAVCIETGEMRCRALGVGDLTLTTRTVETRVSRLLSSLCPVEDKRRTWQVGLKCWLDVNDEKVARFLETVQRELGCDEARSWLSEIVTRSRPAWFSTCLTHVGWEASWSAEDAEAREWLMQNADRLHEEWRRQSRR